MASRAKIVVIDDDVLTLKILTAVLNEQGFQVRVASDADTGFHLAENERADLIILDIDLPKVSGIELLSEFRRNPITQHIPILMLTGETKTKSAGLAFELGASAYFTKPFNHIELQEKVAELVQA